VIPLLTWLHFRGSSHSAGEKTRVGWRALVPAFVLGFVAMAIVRTIGDAMVQANGTAYGVWDAAAWGDLTAHVGDFWGSRVLLGTAMAAVGLNTSLTVFNGVGARPFAVGFAGALVVGAVGMSLALVFGRYVAL
jgi:uncharacterized membrane protein YadS